MKPEEAMEIASRVGLTSVYDASRDSYPNWRAKVIEFAKQVAARTLMNTDPSSFMSYQEGLDAGVAKERVECIGIAWDNGAVEVADAIRARGEA